MNLFPVQPAIGFPGRPDVGVGASTHDELDRHYTPQRLAQVIVDALELDRPRHVLEPSVGGGAFARAVARRWPDAHLTGVDVDPNALGLRQVHAPVVDSLLDLTMDQFDLVVGNPPFDHALEHARHLVRARPRVLAMILPWAYWGVDEWQELLRGPDRPAVVRPIPGRPWPDSVRETAVYEWWPQISRTSDTRIVPLPEWRS